MRPRPPARPGLAHHRHGPLRNLARAASWHRRKLAVLAAIATVLTGLAAAAPPAPPTTSVVRTREPLGGGVVLTSDELEVVDLPRTAVPERTLDLDGLVGQRLAAPVSRHQVLTATALASSATAVDVGRVLAPVRLADADVVALLLPGDRVDVLASDSDGGQTTTVARAVRVVTVPARTADDQGVSTGALVVLDVAGDDAVPLAHAAATGNLTVTWS